MKGRKTERRYYDMRKDPALACLLNLLLVGTGHMYLGQIGKGLVIMVLAIGLGLFTWGIAAVLVIIWAMFDAYSIAKRMDQSAREIVADGMK
jgi:TM2 domain-containing membrane protein YozV